MAETWDEVARAAWQRRRQSEESYLALYQELNAALEKAVGLADNSGQADAISAFIQAYSTPLAADADAPSQAAELMDTTLPLGVLASFVLWRGGIEVTVEDETLARLLAALTLAYMAGASKTASQ